MKEVGENCWERVALAVEGVSHPDECVLAAMRKGGHETGGETERHEEHGQKNCSQKVNPKREGDKGF